MKILNKLQINSDRIMMNEELMTLKGGDGQGGYCLCNCYMIPVVCWACYSSVEQMISDLNSKCGGSGYCSCGGSCES
jgi:hypothetical protein